LRPSVDSLYVADPPAAWKALGFSVVDGVVAVGGVRIRLGVAGRGIVGWSLRGLSGDLDGLPTRGSSDDPVPDVAHPIGAVAVDHIVALTPTFDRTVGALRAAGLDYRRTREARQAFFVVGPCLLEVVAGSSDGDVRFWGLTLVVADLDAAAVELGSRLGPVKDAVQPGRRIATVRPEAGLSVPLALMTPR
jgi:hypothetical protein